MDVICTKWASEIHPVGADGVSMILLGRVVESEQISNMVLENRN